MEVSILLEPLDNEGYRATTLSPEPLVAEATTREEAIEQLRELIRGRFSNAEVVRIEVEVAGESHPWSTLAGSWRDHPDAAEFEQNVSEYRKQVDSDPGRP